MTTPGAPAPWTGAWVADRLGVKVVSEDASLGVDVADLAGLALRRNPRRAHLVVSRVLGKHTPADPRLVYGAGLLLGELVRRTLTGDPALPAEAAKTLAAVLAPGAPVAGADPDLDRLLPAVLAAQPTAAAAYPPVLVFGYAETATGLGHSVADALRTGPYLHSTRRPVPGLVPVAGFDEEHSHAVGHLVLPADPGLLAGSEPLVLVDDELTTGATVRNTVAALHRTYPRGRYVVATLLDLRTAVDRERMAAAADALGVRIDVVALASGHLELPADAVARGAELVAAAERDPRQGGTRLMGSFPQGGRPEADPARARLSHVALGWPAGVASGGRHGASPADRAALERALPAMVDRLAGALWPVDDGADAAGPARSVLVLGVEELLYAPLRLAVALAEAGRAAGRPVEVSMSSTTRSPVLAVDEPGYAIRTALTFPAHDSPADGPGPRYAYNLLDPRGSRRFDAIVLVLDPAADTAALRGPAGLLDLLRACTGHVVVVTVPDPAPPRSEATSAGQLPEPLRGPEFGSYRPDEVGWLLTDLSHVPLEAPLEQREAAVQSGRAHYAESLPIEYRPGPEYLAMFDAALAASAQRVASAVGLVTETVLARHGERTVLVSLARAGTPVGILMRRWAARHGLTLPHYAVSIVRGRGIDEVALRWLSTRHDPADVVFVDGWTGKGAIARELTAALAAHADGGGPRFCPDLAVLADAGGAAPMAGTREDFLIPSACLNSTVSGLVSRTVLRADLIGPGNFHGAKFYPDLAADDVSGRFLDTVTAQFPAVAAAVAVDSARGLGSVPVTWAGWRAVEAIAAAEGLANLNLIKPGVGETTRVLLRRVPRKVLVRADAGADLDHIRLLAAERGVPVETVADLPYSCVGLIDAGAGADS